MRAQTPRTKERGREREGGRGREREKEVGRERERERERDGEAHLASPSLESSSSLSRSALSSDLTHPSSPTFSLMSLKECASHVPVFCSVLLSHARGSISNRGQRGAPLYYIIPLSTLRCRVLHKERNERNDEEKSASHVSVRPCSWTNCVSSRFHQCGISTKQ